MFELSGSTVCELIRPFDSLQQPFNSLTFFQADGQCLGNRRRKVLPIAAR